MNTGMKEHWYRLPSLLSDKVSHSDREFWTDYAERRAAVCSASGHRADYARQVRSEDIKGRIEHVMRRLPINQPVFELVDVVCKRLGSEAPSRVTVRKYIRNYIKGQSDGRE